MCLFFITFANSFRTFNNVHLNSVGLVLGYTFFSTFIFMLLIIAIEFFFYKSHENWWAVFVPGYDTYIFYKIKFESPLFFMFIMIAIPFILGVFFRANPILYYKYGSITIKIATFIEYFVNIAGEINLAKKYGKSPILMIFFGFIFFFDIAFNNKTQMQRY